MQRHRGGKESGKFKKSERLRPEHSDYRVCGESEGREALRGSHLGPGSMQPGGHWTALGRTGNDMNLE